MDILYPQGYSHIITEFPYTRYVGVIGVGDRGKKRPKKIGAVSCQPFSVNVHQAARVHTSVSYVAARVTCIMRYTSSCKKVEYVRAFLVG